MKVRFDNVAISAVLDNVIIEGKSLEEIRKELNRATLNYLFNYLEDTIERDLDIFDFDEQVIDSVCKVRVFNIQYNISDSKEFVSYDKEPIFEGVHFTENDEYGIEDEIEYLLQTMIDSELPEDEAARNIIFDWEILEQH